MSTRLTYTSRQAAELCGLSSYMVEYLARSSTLKPSIRGRRGRGVTRLYSFGDLVALRTIAALLSGGVGVSRLKSGLSTLQRKYGRNIGQTPAKYLYTDGKNVLFRDKAGVLADLSANGQLAFGFVIDLQRVHSETMKAVRKAG